MSLARCVVFALAATSVLSLAPALAADYDPPIYVDPQDEYKPVEIGSGWYLRGDIGYAVNHTYEKESSTTDFDTSNSPLTASVGVGYHFNNFLRGELSAGILPTSKRSTDIMTTCDGMFQVAFLDQNGNAITTYVPGSTSCTGSAKIENKAYDFMARAYADVGTFAGFTPYVGGGVGVVYSSYYRSEGSKDCQDGFGFNCFTDPRIYEGSVESKSQYSFAYSVGAGVAYKVSPNLNVDVGYQYTAAPEAEYMILSNSGPSVEKGIDVHQVKVGLRYDLW